MSRLYCTALRISTEGFTLKHPVRGMSTVHTPDIALTGYFVHLSDVVEEVSLNPASGVARESSCSKNRQIDAKRLVQKECC